MEVSNILFNDKFITKLWFFGLQVQIAQTEQSSKCVRRGVKRRVETFDDNDCANVPAVPVANAWAIKSGTKTNACHHDIVRYLL